MPLHGGEGILIVSEPLNGPGPAAERRAGRGGLYNMHRPLVTLPIIALLFFLSGCSGMGGFGGMTASGGRPTPSSVLLGVALPAGTEYFPSHSSISGQDGVEILRSSSGPAVCAGTIASGLQARGWKVRLSQTSGNRGFYIFENGGRLAIVHVSIQTPPMQTLVQIAAGTQLPDGATVTLPVMSQHTGTPSSATGGTDSAQSEPVPSSTSEPFRDENHIQGRDI